MPALACYRRSHPLPHRLAASSSCSHLFAPSLQFERLKQATTVEKSPKNDFAFFETSVPFLFNSPGV